MKHRPPLVQIDPSRALCWESGETLRIGFDEPVTRVRPTSGDAMRFLRALVMGVERSKVPEYGGDGSYSAHGLSTLDGELREMLGNLEPVLMQREQPQASRGTARRIPRSSIRTVLRDDGREVRGIREALQGEWLCSFESGHALPELAIQILRFLEPLERTRHWLGDGVPHLLIRFTDTSVLIGPLVSPHGAPCHNCEVLGLVDADPALPSIAAQLYGRVPSTESPQLGRLAGAIAASYVHAWRDGQPWVHETQLRLPARGGLVSGLPILQRIAPHPECGCTLGAAER